MDRWLTRRILITAAVLIAVRLGYHLPIPGIDLSGFTGFQHSAGGIFSVPGWAALPPPKLSVFALGLMPYISASVLMLLLSGLIAPLRRLRDGGFRQRLSFDRWILILTGVLALIQGYGIAKVVRTAFHEWGMAAPTTEAYFIPITVLTVTGGALLLTWLAHLITRRGIGNGVALIVVTTILVDLLIGIVHQFQAPLRPDPPLAHTVLFLVFTLAWITLFVLFTQARSTVTLVRRPVSGGDREPADTPAEPVRAPLRVNITGVLPIIAAHTVWQLPFTLAALTGQSDRFGADPLGTFYWVSICLLIILFTYLLAAWIFNARDLLARAARWGFTPLGLGDAGAAVRALDRRVTVTLLPAALLLCALALAPVALFQWFGMQYALTAHYGQELLVVIAVAIAFVRQLRARPYEMEANWVALATFETALETELAQAVLAERGIDAQPQVHRAIPITGSLAPWEVCRPSFPSLVIHRRLGAGHAELWVPQEDRDAAARILAPHLEAEDATVC